MAEAAFNTIAEVQRLRDAGFEQAQAEAITLSIHAGVTGGVATKADVERLEGKFTAVHKDIEVLRGEMTAIKTELEGKIDSATKTTIIWLGGILFVLASALGLLDRLFPPAI